MRSQLLICLEQFKGVVIFATNLVVNYDRAFLSRLINVEFTMPDKVARREIWERHLMGKGIHIPLREDVNLEELATQFEFCGREIKNAVKDACVSAALRGMDSVGQEDFFRASEQVRKESERVIHSSDHTEIKKAPDKEQIRALTEAITTKLDVSSAIKNEGGM